MKPIVDKLINNLTVKSKFTIVLIIIIIIATTAVALVRAAQLQNQVQSQIGERLRSNVSISIGIIETVRMYTIWMLGAVAEMPQTQAALTGGSISALDENLASLFHNMNHGEDGVKAYANMFVFDADLQLVTAAEPGGETVDLSNPLFAQNLSMARAGMPFVSPVAESPTSGLLQFLFTQPVMINGNFSGMAAVLGNTAVLDFFLRYPTYQYDSFINIADSEGTIFFSNRPAYMGKHVDDLGVYEAFGRIPFNEVFEHNSAITGIDKIAYVTVNPALGWTIVSFFDADAVEDVTRVIIISLLPTVSGIILAAAFMVLIVHRALKPLASLTATAKQVAAGNLSVDFNVHRNDEIAQVSRSFLEIITAINMLRDNFESAENAMASGAAFHKL